MITVLIDMVSIGLIIPVLPLLVGSFTGSQADQAFWFGVVTFAFSIANFVASPILGALSDRFGRRPVLLVGFCGLALSFFVTALATRAVDADRGAPVQRRDAVERLGRQRLRRRHHRAEGARASASACSGAMFGLGFILGPVMGGLLGAIDLRLPFFAAGVLALLNLLYGWLRAAGVAAAGAAPAASSGAARQPGHRAEGAGADSAASACWSRSSPARASPSSCSTPPGCSTRPSSSAGDRCRTAGRCSPSASVGARPGRAARPPAEALLAAAAGGGGPRLVDARLRRLGRGDRGLDDVRRDLLQRARLHRRGVDPEHHLRARSTRTTQGRTMGAVSAPATA